MNITEELLAENTAMVEALEFCKGPDGSDNRWLAEVDDWFQRAMTSATTDIGFQRQPDPSRAIVVASDSFSYSEPGEDTPYGWRRWAYVTDLRGKPLGGLDSIDHLPMANCHRCDTLTPFDQKRAQITIYIPRGRFAVEFALCRDCAIWAGSLARVVHERNRIVSDDTYAEFTRSADLSNDTENGMEG